MHKYTIFLLCFTLLTPGCARMKVTKVSRGDLAGHCDDDVEGFRYYLSRPYVHVKNPILVNEWTEIYIATEDGSEVSLLLPQNDDVNDSWTNTQTISQEVNAASVSEMESMRELIRSAEDAPTETPGPEKDDKADEPSGSVKTNIHPISNDLEIVFLPDLDEQYAVHGKNCVSKMDYNLNLQDGWMLTDVSSNADSTPVAIEILNVLNTAIESARNLGMASADKNVKVSPPRVSNATYEQVRNALEDGKEEERLVLYERVHRSYIKPGLYRINKPWETNGHLPVGCGLIAQLGLPITTECVVDRPASEHAMSTVLTSLKHADE